MIMEEFKIKDVKHLQTYQIFGGEGGMLSRMMNQLRLTVFFFYYLLLLSDVMLSIIFKISMIVIPIRVQMEARALMEWLPSRVLVLTDMKETLVRQVTKELLYRQTGPKFTCAIQDGIIKDSVRSLAQLNWYLCIILLPGGYVINQYGLYGPNIYFILL